MNPNPRMQLPKSAPKYTLLIVGLSTGLVSPEAAARTICKDLAASGVDLKKGIEEARAVFAKYERVLSFLDRLVEPKAPPAEPTITIRTVSKG